MTTRIYVVTYEDKHKLVEAASAAQAIRHAVKETYHAHVATTRDMAVLMTKGVTVEKAAAEPRSGEAQAPDHATADELKQDQQAANAAQQQGDK